MMKLTLKHTLVLVVVMAALLVALAGGVIRVNAASVHQSAASHAQQLAWYCPAPPVSC